MLVFLVFLVFGDSLVCVFSDRLFLCFVVIGVSWSCVLWLFFTSFLVFRGHVIPECLRLFPGCVVLFSLFCSFWVFHGRFFCFVCFVVVCFVFFVCRGRAFLTRRPVPR